MPLAELIEAIRCPIPPPIIGLAIDALADFDEQASGNQASVTNQAEADAAAGHRGMSAEELAAEIERLDTSSKRTLRRRYKKLCEKTRGLYDLERMMLPRPSDAPDDHRVEAYYHEEDEHYANTECGYCLLELFNDVLRESRCVCESCDGLRMKLLHYSGACGCGICELSHTHESLDGAMAAAGPYVVPVMAVDDEEMSTRAGSR